MENTNKLMRMAFAAIVFCIGVIILFYETKTYLSTLAACKEIINEDVIYQQKNSNDMETVTHSELIAFMMQPLEYDIMIDDFIISKNTYDVNDITEYRIQRVKYKKSYLYDEYGDIKRLCFNSLG